MSLFAVLLSKSPILAFGYGTDCTFHLYDIGQSQAKKKLFLEKFVAIK